MFPAENFSNFIRLLSGYSAFYNPGIQNRYNEHAVPFASLDRCRNAPAANRHFNDILQVAYLYPVPGGSVTVYVNLDIGLADDPVDEHGGRFHTGEVFEKTLEFLDIPDDILLPIQTLVRVGYMFRGVFMQSADGKSLQEIYDERGEYLLLADKVLNAWIEALDLEFDK